MIGVLVYLTFLTALFLWPQFRQFLIRNLNNLWQIIEDSAPGIANEIRRIFRGVIKKSRAYVVILGVIFVATFGLMILALLLKRPNFTGFVFVITLSLILLAWLPAGLVSRTFKVSKTMVPQGLRTMIAWMAFIGFIAVAFPDAINFRILMAASLVGFIAFGAGAKMNILGKIVLPMVIIMIMALAWKKYYPDNFRSTTRFANSWGKKINTLKDRKSINNETDAATTYAVALKDINELYEFDDNDSIYIIDKQIKRGAEIRLVSHKDEVRIRDNQGFVNIQLARENGSFVNGPKYWVQAEFVQIASPRDIVPKDDSLLPKNQQTELGQGYFPRDSIFTKGVYFIIVEGETPFNINVVSDEICKKYELKSVTDNNYRIIYDDGVCIDDGPGKEITADNREYPRFKLVEHNAKEITKVRLVVN